MSIAGLRKLAAPPDRLSGSGDTQRWVLAEKQLGCRVPEDYRELVQTYGAGRFGNFIAVFTPFASDAYVNLLSQDELALDAYREVRAAFPDAAPFPAYPEPGGVLPWAKTDNGDIVYWLTDGPPEAWPIIVMESRHGFYERYALTTTEFLTRLLDGTLHSRVFPAELPIVGPRFESIPA